MICPGCGYALRGLPLQGLCPECGAPYEPWMLYARPEPTTPTWVKPSVIVLGGSWTIVYLGILLIDSGFGFALIGGAFGIAGHAVSLGLTVATVYWIGSMRGPRASGTVAFFGLCGVLAGGPGVLLFNVISVGYLDPFHIIWQPFYQVAVTLMALIAGIAIWFLGSLIGSSLANDDQEIVRKAREQESETHGRKSSRMTS